jgi:hypothetical protein
MSDTPMGRDGFLKRVPLHTALLPICATLAPFATNRFEVEADSVIGIMLVMVLGALCLLLLLRLFLRSWRLAGIAASAILFYVLYVPTLIYTLGATAGVTVFGTLIVLLLLGVRRLRRSRAALGNLTLILNVVVMAAPIANLWTVVDWYAGSGRVTIAAADAFPDLPPAVPGATAAVRPDIWYFVPDRYASADAIGKYAGFDNSPFVEMLRQKGFTVVDNAHSNYQRTAVSLGSVLNLDYLDVYRKFQQLDGRDFRPLYRALTDNRVSRFLHQAGYRLHHFGSHWEPTRRDPHADVHHNVLDMPEFAHRLMSANLLGQISHLTGLGPFDSWYSHCRRLNEQYRAMVDLAASNEPKYVMAHLLVTHPPFALTAEGNCLSIDDAAKRSDADAYIDSVKYANTEFSRLVDAILAGPRPAIIVLMADEGPWPDGLKLERAATRASGETVDWAAMTDEQLDIKTGILMAIHLPTGPAPYTGADDPFPKSPVNVFRMIFRRYFGAALPALPDRYFVYSSENAIYNFIDVTNRLPR